MRTNTEYTTDEFEESGYLFAANRFLARFGCSLIVTGTVYDVRPIPGCPGDIADGMDGQWFVDSGVLYALNLHVFHPAGMAMAVTCDVDDNTSELTVAYIGPFFDNSGSTTHGMVYTQDVLPEETKSCAGDLLAALDHCSDLVAKYREMADERIARLGRMVQLTPTDPINLRHNSNEVSYFLDYR